MLGIAAQRLEGVRRRVVEREAGRLAKLWGKVSQLSLEFGVLGQHFMLGRLQNTVEPSKDGKRQDHVRVLAAFEIVPQQVRHGPDKADLFAEVVHYADSDVASLCDRKALDLSPSFKHGDCN